MELRSNFLDLDVCETWNGWMWDAKIMTWLQHELKNFGTRIDVRRCMEWWGGGVGVGVGEGAGCEVRNDLYGGETYIFRCRWPWDMGPGWDWDAFSGTCIGVSHKLDCDETKMWDSGLSCSTTWMKVTCESRGLGGYGTRRRWGENHIATCIELRWGLNGGEPQYGWWLK